MSPESARVAASGETQTVSLGPATGAPATSTPNCGGKGYVVVDSRGIIQQSEDLEHWTARKQLINPGVLDVVAFGADKYVVTEMINSTQSKVYNSSDGVKWTEVATIPMKIARVVWDPVDAQFIITSRDSLPSTPIATSPDGVTWTTHPFPPRGVFAGYQSGNPTAAASGAGLHVVATLGGFRGSTGQPIHSLYTTPDWSTYTYRPSPFDTDPSLGVANQSIVWDVKWNGTLFVAVGLSYWNDSTGVHLSCTIATSPDGITWTRRTSPFDVPLTPEVGSAGIRAVAWNGIWWTAVGAGSEGFISGDLDHGGPFIATSEDGSTWARRRLADVAVDPMGPAWDQGWCVDGANGITVAGGDHRTPSDSQIATSRDEITWRLPQNDFALQDPSTPAIYGIAIGAGGCGCSNGGQRVDSRVIGARVVTRGAP